VTVKITNKIDIGGHEYGRGEVHSLPVTIAQELINKRCAVEWKMSVPPNNKMAKRPQNK